MPEIGESYLPLNDEEFQRNAVESAANCGLYVEVGAYTDETDSQCYYCLTMTIEEHSELLREINYSVREKWIELNELLPETLIKMPRPLTMLPWQELVKQTTFFTGAASRREAIIGSARIFNKIADQNAQAS